MDRETRGLLVGMVLGDGYLNVAKRKNRHGYTWVRSEMKISHSIDQEAYCEHKAELLRRRLGRKCTVGRGPHGPGARYQSCYFTLSHKYFRALKRRLYPYGEKTFTRQALDMLTPHGIAIWYMDDGSPRRNCNSDGRVTSVSTDIATMCSQEEAELICAYFREVHGITFRARPSKGQFYIQANTAESRKFADLVAPFLIPEMAYKLSHVQDLGSHERRAPVGSCSCGRPIYANRRRGMCDACYAKHRYDETKRVMR